jgi:hypothetical protein
MPAQFAIFSGAVENPVTASTVSRSIFETDGVDAP